MDVSPRSDRLGAGVTDVTAAHVDEPTRRLVSGRLARIASTELFLVAGAVTLVLVFLGALGADVVAIDFRQFYDAAGAMLRGEDPYVVTPDTTAPWGGPYPYPPLPGLLAIVLTPLPFEVAGLMVMGMLVVAALGTIWLAGVRDWRCYGLAMLWPPVISAIQTGNLTLWLALACVVAWRYRDRPFAASASIGITLAAKFFLWPLVVWFLATRRALTALLTVAVGAIVLLVSWAVIGFHGFTGYPSVLRRLENTVGEDSYTVYITGLDLGLPSPVARLLWLGVGLSLLGVMLVLARRGDELSAFVLAIPVALALTPIVWPHYFALFLAVVAIAQPRLSVLWFVPLAMVLTPGSGHPSPFQTAWTLGVAAVIVTLALRATLARRRAEPAEPSRQHVAAAV